METTDRPATAEYRALVVTANTLGITLASKLATEGNPQPLYLYARHSEPGKTGALRLVPDSEPAPDGWQLVTPEPLRTSTPYDDFFAWIYARARNQPVLAID